MPRVVNKEHVRHRHTKPETDRQTKCDQILRSCRVGAIKSANNVDTVSRLSSVLTAAVTRALRS